MGNSVTDRNTERTAIAPAILVACGLQAVLAHDRGTRVNGRGFEYNCLNRRLGRIALVHVVSLRNLPMSKRFACVFTGLLVVVGMVGCGGASDVKFDATSSTTSAESIGAITSGMTEDQKQVFVARALAVSQLIQVKAGTPSTSLDTAWKGIHGMTRSQIEIKANELLPTKVEPTK